MKIVSLMCPNCNGTLDVRGDGLDVITCDHCGSRLMVEKMNRRILGTKIYLRELEHDERMQDKAYEFAEKQLNYKLKKRGLKILENESKNIIGVVVWIIGTLILLVIPLLLFLPSKCSHDSKIAKLEQIEDEVIEAINNEDYDVARAKTNQLRLDDGYSSEATKAWDEKREEYIKIINQKENGDDGDWWPFW